ncbi:molybdenum cofactor guanylyltransferase [Leucobacter luti]|uniref:molybdenum cofactor guanylyltransferase n=1 Tax=Leucobacter luti TaxID=340320 RepID=UPI0010476A30|nr:NTP transferase domain-containing protein [Leucobacter luti]
MGELDAILFAGGRGSRLGGVDKAELRLGGARLVDRVVAGARAAGAHRIVVVGPAHVVPAGCRAAREDPPFGGPLAALAAALAALPEEYGPEGARSALLLSCDLVHPAAVAARLVRESLGDSEAVVLRDPDGRGQWLAGRYRLSALRAGAALAGAPTGGRLRAALAGMSIRFVDVPAELVADIDTPADLAHARATTLEAPSARDPEPPDPDDLGAETP